MGDIEATEPIRNLIRFENLDGSQIKTELQADRIVLTWHKDRELMATISLSPDDALLVASVLRLAIQEREEITTAAGSAERGAYVRR